MWREGSAGRWGHWIFWNPGLDLGGQSVLCPNLGPLLIPHFVPAPDHSILIPFVLALPLHPHLWDWPGGCRREWQAEDQSPPAPVEVTGERFGSRLWGPTHLPAVRVTTVMTNERLVGYSTLKGQGRIGKLFMADSSNTALRVPALLCLGSPGCFSMGTRLGSWLMGVARLLPGSVTWARPYPFLSLRVVVALSWPSGWQ